MESPVLLGQSALSRGGTGAGFRDAVRRPVSRRGNRRRRSGPNSSHRFVASRPSKPVTTRPAVPFGVVNLEGSHAFLTTLLPIAPANRPHAGARWPSDRCATTTVIIAYPNRLLKLWRPDGVERGSSPHNMPRPASMPFEIPLSAWLVRTRLVKPEDPCHSLGEPITVCHVPIITPVPRLFGARIPSATQSRLCWGVIGRGSEPIAAASGSPLDTADCALARVGQGLINVAASTATLRAAGAVVRSASKLIHIPSTERQRWGQPDRPRSGHEQDVLAEDGSADTNYADTALLTSRQGRHTPLADRVDQLIVGLELSLTTGHG
jgi:hypothetical protein